jgi:hypothetical protein
MEVSMALLQVRDCPQELYESLAQVAKAENRSTAQQTVVLIRDALNIPSNNALRRRQLFSEIDMSCITLGKGAPSAESLIREDRDR